MRQQLGRVLRACPDATPGPSRLPASAIFLARRRATPRSQDGWTYRQARSESSTTTSSVISAATTGSSPARTSPRTPASAHPHPAFESLAASLSATQPCFGARGDEVKLLTGPGEFYKGLIEMIKRARRRIFISSLYIGAEEAELVETIRTALASNNTIRATFMLDYHRSTRLTPSDSHPPSTAHLLLPLIEEFGDRVEVWMYRSPNLRGLLERIVPERYDEAWGTWHGKWYCVDDEAIMSGANLAGSYFTNRQDRYIHFRSHPTLLSYLSSLTRLYTHYSYLLSPSPPASAPPQYIVPLRNVPASSKSAALYWHHPSILPRSFGAHALATLTAFQNSWKTSNASRTRRVDVDTWFWPVLQAGVLGLREEEKALERVFEAVSESSSSPPVPEESPTPSSDEKEKEPVTPPTQESDTQGVQVDLTSGYFSLYDTYQRLVIESPAPVKIIAASPKANGFYGSKGFSRLIPEGYTYLESQFHRQVVSNGRNWDQATSKGVRLREWEREGWTYHAKGIWLSPSSSSSYPSSTPNQSPNPHSSPNPNPPSPFLTFIGSSNLSNRSLNLDTELSLLLMTSSPSLRKALANELRTLDRDAKDVGEETWKKEERRVSWLAWGLVKAGVEDYL